MFTSRTSHDTCSMFMVSDAPSGTVVFRAVVNGSTFVDTIIGLWSKISVKRASSMDSVSRVPSALKVNLNTNKTSKKVKKHTVLLFG